MGLLYDIKRDLGEPKRVEGRRGQLRLLQPRRRRVLRETILPCPALREQLENGFPHLQ